MRRREVPGLSTRWSISEATPGFRSIEAPEFRLPIQSIKKREGPIGLRENPPLGSDAVILTVRAAAGVNLEWAVPGADVQRALVTVADAAGS